MLRGKISQLLGSLLAATFVSPRLIVWLRFPALVSPFRAVIRSPFRQCLGFGYAACQPKGAEVGQSLLYQAYRPHPLPVSQALKSALLAPYCRFSICLSETIRIFANQFKINALRSPFVYHIFATYLQHIRIID